MPTKYKKHPAKLPRCAVVLALLLWTGAAVADNYKVSVDAPKEVKKILTDYLDIVRYKSRDDIKDEYLDYLMDTTPEQVASLMATQGYFDVRTQIIENTKKASVNDVLKPDLTIKVTLGDRTMVKSAQLEVKGLVASQDPKKVGELEFDWSLQEDEPFTQDEWSVSKTLLLRKIRADAYAAAKFEKTQALVVPEKKTVELSASLDSGPYFTLGEVKTTGLRRYPARVVENMNVIAVGEAYSRAKLLDYQKRLQNLPYFSSVVVDVNADVNDAQLTPINVQVVELPTQNFKGLVGYGTDAGYHANAQYSHYNVFNKGWIFDTKADWQYIDREGRIALTTPQNKNHYQWSVVGKVVQQRNTTLDTDTGQLGVHYAKKLEHTSLSYDLDYYHSRAKSSSTDVLSRALFAGVTWAKNSVDNPSFPRKGYAVEAALGGGVQGVASSASFLRAYGRYRHFLPFKKDDSLVLRLEGGAIVSGDSILEIPAPLMFLAGGSSSIRGYAYQSIGDTRTLGTGAVYSAKYLATASAEYTHWFNKSWGAAVFYDVGFATSSLSNVSLQHGAGIGARWRSPVGPINFDLAYGYPRKKLAPHISIGILF